MPPVADPDFLDTSLDPSTPYVVLGFGASSRKNKSRRPLRMGGSFDVFHFSGVAISPGKDDESDKKRRVPWSNELITAFGYAKTAELSLPPFTDAVGAASGVDCFPVGTVDLLKVEKCNTIIFPDGTAWGGVKGIIYPVSYPRSGRVVCRRTLSDVQSHPKDHRVSAGFAITADCSVDETQNSAADAGPVSRRTKFTMFSEDYAVRDIDENIVTLHNPHFLPDLPKSLRRSALMRSPGLKVKIVVVPILVALFCVLLLVTPGVVQYYGSNDNRWGDVVNQAIGTGSVLLGVVFLLFQRVFGTDFYRKSAWRGKVTLRKDLAAKVFAREMVKEISELACDPRVPPRLIANHYNCAVRADRSGWLRVGCSIRMCDMMKHGYFVMKDRGMVLDVIEARFYSCSKFGKVVHINRPGRQVVDNLCKSFEGDEVFE